MGEANFCTWCQDSEGLFEMGSWFVQETYIRKVIERINMHYAKPNDIPFEKGQNLSLDLCPKHEKKERRCTLC